MRSEVVVADEDIAIRRMRDDDADYELMVKWRNLPHVWRWWDPDLPARTLASIKEEYLPDTLPGAASTACIVERRGEPIGFVQYYRWVSYGSEAAEIGIPFDDRSYGLDILIGEPDLIHKGLGTKVVTLLSDHLIEKLNASTVALNTDVANHAAQRCYEKAGFVKIEKILDTDTYQGRRVWTWLMVKEGSGSAGGAS